VLIKSVDLNFARDRFEFETGWNRISGTCIDTCSPAIGASTTRSRHGSPMRKKFLHTRVFDVPSVLSTCGSRLR
jgi:hypothetical protein